MSDADNHVEELGQRHMAEAQMCSDQAKMHTLALLGEMQGHVKALEHALEDAINSPKGVVPDSAVSFWDGKRGRVRNTLER